MKNSLTDLTNHLFAQLERLGDEGKTQEQLRDEIARSGAVTALGREIINAGRLAIDAQKTAYECAVNANQRAPRLLGLDLLNQERDA